MTWSVVQGDCIEYMDSLPADSVDLIFTSPPYEMARLYLENGQDMGIARKTEDWVAWLVKCFTAGQRVCKGLQAYVVAGQTRKFRWSAGPALLLADLHRAGFNLRNPPIYHRVGIPGSGGPDWLRADYEFIVCTSRPGKLLWSDNTAAGHTPKWAPGGEMSNRGVDGKRANSHRNQWGGTQQSNGHKKQDGTAENFQRPSHKYRRVTRGKKAETGDTQNTDSYTPPSLANPGNIIRCKVGGGLLGNELAHQNEAPFPEALADVFVRSFCPPGGVVLDPFCGSGTTGAVAVRHGRNFLGCDLRQSQVDLARKRISQETPLGLFSDTQGEDT